MSLTRSVGNSTLISAFGTVVSYALTILLARDSGVTQFGEYLLCLAWAAIMTVLIDCASDAAFSHLSINNENVQSSFNTAVTIRLAALLCSVGLFGFAKATDLIDITWLVFIFVMPAFNLGLLFEYYRSNIVFASIICAEKIALLLTTFSLLSFVRFEVAVYLSYAAVTLVSLAWQAYLHGNHIRAFRPARTHAIKAYGDSYWPLLFIALAQMGYGHFSRLIIESKQGIVVFASVSLAFQVIALASVVQNQVDRSFRPMIIETVRAADTFKLRQLIVQYLLISTLPMAIGMIILIVTAPRLINFIFGSEYRLAGQVLTEISPLFISVSLMRLTDLIMLALGLARQSLAVNLGASLMMLLLMQSMPATQSLTIFMAIIVGAQFSQAMLSGALAFRALQRRFG
jgi:O-antigen/teichoic acid export membrane protein